MPNGKRRRRLTSTSGATLKERQGTDGPVRKVLLRPVDQRSQIVAVHVVARHEDLQHGILQQFSKRRLAAASRTRRFKRVRHGPRIADLRGADN